MINNKETLTYEKLDCFDENIKEFLVEHISFGDINDFDECADQDNWIIADLSFQKRTDASVLNSCTGSFSYIQYKIIHGFLGDAFGFIYHNGSVVANLGFGDFEILDIHGGNFEEKIQKWYEKVTHGGRDYDIF